MIKYKYNVQHNFCISWGTLWSCWTVIFYQVEGKIECVESFLKMEGLRLVHSVKLLEGC
jgi:hypothetical protein